MGLPVPALVLVDDDQNVLRIVSRWAVEAGYDVVSFNQFESARSYLLDHAPDVIVTDVRLGAFNGLQLVHLAKSARPTVRVVVMSGFDDPVLAEEARREGAVYLSKPLTRDDVLSAIGPSTPPS
jgi:two-component system, response regulator RegA